MRPRTFAGAFADAFRKGYSAARQNLRAMLAILGVMAFVVALYYLSPQAAAVLQRFARWEHSGGVLAAALASALAGGFLSEASLVYIQEGGRWTTEHLGNVVFKMALFAVSGAAVYEFYAQQAVWFGNGVSWSILVPKILVDQFIYTPIWSVPTQTTATRWQALHYSGRLLRQEWGVRFVMDRMLPVLVTNWYFWLPGVTLIYAMPQNLQMPLAILANAIWGILLSATARQPNRLSTATVQDLVPAPAILPLIE